VYEEIVFEKAKVIFNQLQRLEKEIQTGISALENMVV
jgi:hypothetical protein